MNYQKIYYTLIEIARCRNTVNEYTESHHIIPKCMGGTDDKSNLVTLSAREHFVAHILLVKMYPNNTSLLYAANMMCRGNSRNNRSYAWFRKKFSTMCSQNQKGANNNQYGKQWIFHEEHQQSKIIHPQQLEDYILKGWKVGRKLKWNKETITKTCKRCGQLYCERPSICSKHQMINTLIAHFTFNKETLGSKQMYEEYDRVVSLIEEDYYNNKMSTIDFVKKYNISSTQHVDSIFNSLGIIPRTYVEAAVNYKHKKRPAS